MAVTAAATGDGLRALGMRGMGSGDVVEWNEDGSCVRSYLCTYHKYCKYTK